MSQEMKRVFTVYIEHAQQRQYLRVPFMVEPDMESLTISYVYPRHRLTQPDTGRTLRSEINTVDLALEDVGGVLVGASGAKRTEITVHENWATPSYRPTTMTPGQWHLVLGAYRIEEQGCPVEITITQRPKECVLLKGDCHLHTLHSDGWYSVEELTARARQDRLDYLFITDHNSMTSNDWIHSYPDLTVLPGVEMTYYEGHYNFLGVPRPVKTYTANGRDEVLAIMREGRASGALCSLNHPMSSICGWHFGFGPDVPADLIEIWNGPFQEINQETITLWHNALCQGRRWPAIGGSDCHRAEMFLIPATPTTFLYSRSRSGSDILEALRKGHAYVGMNPEAPGIHLAMGEARMGDVYTGETIPLRLTLERLPHGAEVRILDQTGIVWQTKPGPAHRYEMEYLPEGSSFLRVEIWRTLPVIGLTLASISNPIYMA